MKLFIHYILLIVAFSSCTSKKILTGTYSNSLDNVVQFEGSNIELLDHRKVRVNHWSDTGEFYGEGTYSQKGNKLIIKFRELNISQGEYILSELDVNYIDAFIYQVEAISQDLFGAMIYAIDKDGKIIHSNTIKQEGIGVLKVPKASVINLIRIAAFGYATLDIPIEKQGSKKVEIYLEDNFKKFIKGGTKEVYKIESNEQKILLKKGNITYRHVDVQ